MKQKILSIFLILSMVFTTFIATSIKSNAGTYVGGSTGSGGARYHWGYYVMGDKLCSYIRLDNWRGGSWVFDVHDQASYNDFYNATGGFSPNYIGCRNQWLLTGAGWNGYGLVDFITAFNVWRNNVGMPNVNMGQFGINGLYTGSANARGVAWPTVNGNWVWGINITNDLWETVTITESGGTNTRNALVRVDTVDTSQEKITEGLLGGLYKTIKKEDVQSKKTSITSADTLYSRGGGLTTYQVLIFISN